MLGRLSKSICNDFDGKKGSLSDGHLRRLAAEIVKGLRDYLPRFTLVEIMFTLERTIYVVLDGVDISAIRFQLPGMIAHCPAGYVLDKELHRPAWADLKTKRVMEPQPLAGVVDDTAYDVLRPGVLIYSNKQQDHGHPEALASTTGVLVRKAYNDVFMTCAAHGVGEDGTVYQLLPTGEKKIVGHAVQEISFTDVALVQLENDAAFTNEIFENDAGVASRFTRLFGEDPDDDQPQATGVYLNSPYTGDMEGVIVMKSVKLETIAAHHPTEENLRYVVYNWIFTGQVEGAGNNIARPPDGTYGSAIWDDDGIVTGFFRYHIAKGEWAGFCAAVSASEVVNAGTGWHRRQLQ